MRFVAMLAAAPLLADPWVEARAIVEKRCIGCHGPKTKSGGLDLSSRETAASRIGLIMARVDKGQMPPTAPMPPAERAVLRAWIGAGAPWSAPIEEKRAGPDWWSLRPVRETAPPSAPGDWGQSTVDRWIHAKLRDNELEPSPRADRRTLIRRVTFDLTGLPPTPAEIDAFVNDPAPDAWERLVRRLLASPRYGERWARHWLDVVRYAESEGFERDLMREHAWRYRDFTIRAFNEDKPYDRFAREQMAGDLIEPVTHDSIAATAFLAFGPLDAVGLSSAVPQERDLVREDYLEELTGVVSQTFLGLTANCARCHDHKFDPIPQRDYYRLKAAFSNVWPSTRDDSKGGLDELFPHGKPLLTPAERDARESRLAPLRTRIETLAAAIGKAYRDASPADRAGLPQPVARWRFDTDARDESGAMHAEANGAEFHEGALRPAGKRDSVTISTAHLGRTVGAKTIEAWIRVAAKPAKAVTLVELRNLSGYRGASSDGVQFAGKKGWQNTSVGGFRTKAMEAPAEDTPVGGRVHIAIAYEPGGEIRIYRNGGLHGAAYVPDPATPAGRLQTYHPGDAIARFTVNNELWLEEVRIHAEALPAARIAALFEAGPANAPAEALRAARVESLEAELKSAREQLAAEPAPPLAFAADFRTMGPTHILTRGDVTRKGEAVTPAGLSCLNGPAAMDRRAVAEWIASDRNPAFARVMVNRVWHYHFGSGLAANPNDFGFNGGKPSHPELLDWLAASFVRGGWSVKKLHERILLTETYRQSSAFRPDAAAKDSDSRLLWRYPPRRLEGEPARDSMLAVSGVLNEKMHGPSFRPFKLSKTGSYQNYAQIDSDDPEFQRRTIYRMSVNTGAHPMLEALDCPLPSVKTPKRAVTTTPLQALSMMNNEFVRRMSKAFAARLEREAAGADARVELGFRLAFGRPPSPAEADWSRDLAARHGWDAFCWGLFNASEFLYVL